jgi:hypothetical protein
MADQVANTSFKGIVRSSRVAETPILKMICVACSRFQEEHTARQLMKFLMLRATDAFKKGGQDHRVNVSLNDD